MIRTLVFYLLFSVSYATTCGQLKTLYSDLTCCGNPTVDTCLRTIPLCASATNGEICTDSSDHAIIKGGVTATIPTASTTVLGGVKVDGSSIIIANGIISSSTTTFSGDYNDLTNKPTIVHFSGDYDDLTNKPTIPTAFSGDYDDLTNKPTIPSAYTLPTASTTELGGVKVDGSSIIIADGIISAPIGSSSSSTAFSGDYDYLTNKPVLFSGSYVDLSNLPSLFNGDYNSLTNKPSLFDGNYNSLSNKPSILTSYNDLTDKPTIPSAYNLPAASTTELGGVKVDGTTITISDGVITSSQIGSIATASTTVLGGVKIDGTTITISNGVITAHSSASGVTSYNDLTDKPTLFSGSYTDLTNKPTLFSGDYAELTNKPTIPTAFSGSYNDLTNVPTLFDGNYDDLTNKPTLFSGSYVDLTNKPTAFSGSYVDLTNKPTIPTAFSGDYDDLTNKPTIPTAFSGDYDDLTNKPTATYVEVNSGNAAVEGSDVYVTQSACAALSPYGGAFSAGSGTFPIGCIKSGGTTYYWNPDAGDAGTACGSSGYSCIQKKTAFSGDYNDLTNKPDLSNVGGGGSNVQVDNSTIKQHTNGTIYVANAPSSSTALLSAQTFEVTQAECMSSALITSIKAQLATKFPQYTYGTEAEAVVSESKIPSACLMFIDTAAPDYNRILYNSHTADPDDILGSGYDTSTVTHRVCKYANGDFVLLTDPTKRCKTVHFTLPDNLNTLAGVLQVSSTNLGLGISPTAPLHVGTGASTSISTSRYECDGSGAIIEQNNGEVETVMTYAQCSTLPNFEFGVAQPATTATKTADSICLSVHNSPYNFNTVIITSGTPDLSMNEQECQIRAESTSGAYWDGADSWSHIPSGCVASDGKHHYNRQNSGQDCGAGTYECVQKLNTKIQSDQQQPVSADMLTSGECNAYALSIDKSFSTISESGANPKGCFDQGGTIVYFNSANSAGICGNQYNSDCVMKETKYDNPGTPNDQHRVNACRDACANRDSPLFSGSWDFRSASFWVEPTGGQCFCGEISSTACIQQASTFYDLYELHNKPQGCYKDSSTGEHYHNSPIDDNYGQCSAKYPCLRTGGCLVQDTTTETKELSIISEKSAWFKQEVVISSDRRIKENIVDVEHAREKMRLIAARNYSYIDKRKHNGTTVGFIAQEVAQVMPEAVKIEKGFVPNLLKRVSCSFAWNVTLKMTCAELASGRVRLFVTNKGGESLLDVEVTDGVMEVEEVYTVVYAFGYEVEDFHTLEKSKLFALNFAATKELDQEVQLLRQEMDAIKQAVGI